MSTPDGTIEAPRRGRKKNDMAEGVDDVGTPLETTGGETMNGEAKGETMSDETTAPAAMPAEAMPAEAMPGERSDASSVEIAAASEAGTMASESASSAGEVPAVTERRRIEEQLVALERKQAELRRALAVADHPALAEAIRVIEGRAYAVTRAEAKMAEGLTKSEDRRRETLTKKLESARAKRDELAAQVAELEKELAPLGEERTRALAAERKSALTNLFTALGANEDAFRAAGLEVATLVPEVARFMPEIVALAEEIVANGRG